MFRRTAGQTPQRMRVVLDVAGASVGVASIGVLDAKVPGDLDATALYLALVALIAWRTFAAVGLLTAIAAALTAISVDFAAHPANFAAVAIWNGGAGLAIFVGVALLVRKLRVERDALRAAATHDGLTSLPNRVLLLDRLEQALLAAGREKFCVGVLVFDLDGFKKVNDTLGHHAGDQLLRLVASRARSCIRASDTCARVGGDEFVVLLSRTSPGGAARVAEVLARSCAEPFLIDGAPVSVAASIGTAVAPEDGADPDTLLRLADARMYQAKSLARNGVATKGGMADLASR
jgi:diguanylate cyclase (GGDEF)-like protein